VWLDNSVLIGVMERGAEGSRTTDLVRVTPSEIEPVAALMTETDRYCEWSPAVSPAGQTIAFESNDGGDREIFAVLARRGVVDLSNHREADWNPVWSPDGVWVAFESFRGGRRGIYRVNPGRTAVQPIAADRDADNWSPAWSPDATELAFVSNRSGRSKLYVVSAEGGEARALFAGTDAEEFAPAWRPKARP
jgi:TolB protein